MKPNALPIAVVALLLLASCASGRAEWREFQTGPCPFEDAWNGFVEIATDDSYPAAGGTDRGEKRFESRWRTLELPFRKGYRKRVCAEFEPADAGGWRIRYYVEQQKVDQIDKQLRPEEQDWVPNGQHVDTERRFEWKLRRHFGTPVEAAARGG